jgi:hypothetical protein
MKEDTYRTIAPEHFLSRCIDNCQQQNHHCDDRYCWRLKFECDPLTVQVKGGESCSYRSAENCRSDNLKAWTWPRLAGPRDSDAPFGRLASPLEGSREPSSDERWYRPRDPPCEAKRSDRETRGTRWCS